MTPKLEPKNENSAGPEIAPSAKTVESPRANTTGEFAAGIAHDCNNILVTILGSAEMLRADLDEGSPLRAYAEAIITSATKLTELNALLIAKTRGYKAKARRVDLSQITRETVELLRPTIRRDIAIDLELTDENLVVVAGSIEVTRVISNIVINAAESIAAVGKVIVRTGRESSAAAQTCNLCGTKLIGNHLPKLVVSDSGAGIDKKSIEKIFEPDFSTKREDRGLGLAAVKEIIESIGACVVVESRVGAGTSFSVFFKPA
ncbi:MAG: ATP-binding protein [Planctomycetes bacterium]|nr:ATP-binding protein [Planctomycetota bacterium]